MLCRLGVGGETNCNFARCEQPGNKNTRNSTLYFTSNRVVALFTGGRSSATIHNGEDDYSRQHPSLSLRGRLSCLHIVDVLAARAA